MEKYDSCDDGIEEYRPGWYRRAFQGNGDIRKLPLMIPKRSGRPCITKKRLIEDFGWTRSLIGRFLGKPDKRKRNKHNRKRETALYNIDRVETAQMSSEFMASFRKANKRRLATAKAIDTKIQRLDAKPVKVRVVERDLLTKKSCEYFEQLMENDASLEEPIDPEEFRPDFLAYVVGLYIREHLVTFQAVPGQLQRKKLHWSETDEQTKKKVLYEIGKVYPWLRHECIRLLKSDHPDMIREEVCGDFYVL
jgi:uncharacterized protein YnzC (UPF0291/DUF896 family)